MGVQTFKLWKNTKSWKTRVWKFENWKWFRRAKNKEYWKFESLRTTLGKFEILNFWNFENPKFETVGQTVCKFESLNLHTFDYLCFLFSKLNVLFENRVKNTTFCRILPNFIEICPNFARIRRFSHRFFSRTLVDSEIIKNHQTFADNCEIKIL